MIATSLNVLNKQGELVDKIELNERVFGCEYKLGEPDRFKPLHQTIRWFLNRRRAGTQSVKNRSNVSGAHRKLWAQKETGKARQGDGKAPHFRGGGIAFGIDNRSYDFKLNRKFRNLAMRIALTHKAQNEGILVLDDLTKCDLSKTKLVKAFVEEQVKEKRVLFVVPYQASKEMNLSGINNIPYVDFVTPGGLNVYELSQSKLVCDKNSIIEIQNRLNK